MYYLLPKSRQEVVIGAGSSNWIFPEVVLELLPGALSYYHLLLPTSFLAYLFVNYLPP